MLFGYPSFRQTRSGTSTTPVPRQLNLGSMAGENFVTVPIIVNTRTLVASNNWSCTKSIAQTSFCDESAARPSRNLAFTFPFGDLFRNCRQSMVSFLRDDHQMQGMLQDNSVGRIEHAYILQQILSRCQQH